MLFLKRILTAAAVFTGLSTIAAPASAGFELCNDTHERMDFAFAYESNGDWVSEGWWVIEPWACRTIMNGALNNRYYYLYAETRSQHWRGDYSFCFTRQRFKSFNNRPCSHQGMTTVGFRKVDTGRHTSWIHRLWM